MYSAPQFIPFLQPWYSHKYLQIEKTSGERFFLILFPEVSDEEVNSSGFIDAGDGNVGSAISSLMDFDILPNHESQTLIRMGQS